MTTVCIFNNNQKVQLKHNPRSRKEQSYEAYVGFSELSEYDIAVGIANNSLQEVAYEIHTNFMGELSLLAKGTAEKMAVSRVHINPEDTVKLATSFHQVIHVMIYDTEWPYKVRNYVDIILYVVRDQHTHMPKDDDELLPGKYVDIVT